jgi:hypothetical protein
MRRARLSWCSRLSPIGVDAESVELLLPYKHLLRLLCLLCLVCIAVVHGVVARGESAVVLVESSLVSRSHLREEVEEVRRVELREVILRETRRRECVDLVEEAVPGDERVRQTETEGLRTRARQRGAESNRARVIEIAIERESEQAIPRKSRCTPIRDCSCSYRSQSERGVDLRSARVCSLLDPSVSYLHRVLIAERVGAHLIIVVVADARGGRHRAEGVRLTRWTKKAPIEGREQNASESCTNQQLLRIFD